MKQLRGEEEKEAEREEKMEMETEEVGSGKWELDYKRIF